MAISTACAALNYIVVETASDAQRCVELLRRRSLGVATFLILEKQKGLAGQMNEAVQTPEGEHRHTIFRREDSCMLIMSMLLPMQV